METNPKKQRQHFFGDYTSGRWSIQHADFRPAIEIPGDPSFGFDAGIRIDLYPPPSSV